MPSPKVATYDLQPEMSAARRDRRAGRSHRAAALDFIVANFANPDMVGHTGVWDAAVARRASSSTAASARVLDARCLAAGGALLSSPPTTATPTRCATRRAAP